MGCGGSKDEKKPQVDKKKDQHKKDGKTASPQDQKTASPKDAKATSPAAGEDAASPSGQQSGVPTGATMETVDAKPSVSTVHDRQAPADSQVAPAAAAGTSEGEPTVNVVKRRPARATRAAADPATPGASAIASRAAPAPVSTGKPIGNYEDYTSRQAPAVVQQPVVDAEGHPVLDAEGKPVMEEVPAPAGAKADMGNGQLIERKEPVWTVARPPPPTQGWVLLRQVRVVMQMRKLTAI